MSNKNFFWGSLLIVIGIIGALNATFHFSLFRQLELWPFFVLVPGLIFEYYYFAYKKSPGLLVPGGMLTTIGLLFFFETFTNWHFSNLTWPIYLLAVVVGLGQLYLFGTHDRGLLIPIFILSTIALVFLCQGILNHVFRILNHSYTWPIIFIIIGLTLLFTQNSSKKL